MQGLIDSTVTRERVTVVTAPSGYGKTSAVSAWAAVHRDQVAWLTLSAFDADPHRLDTGIVQALQSLARSGNTDFAEILAVDAVSDDPGDTLETLSDALDGAQRPVYLVIDDAHRAREALAEGLLGALIDTGPDPLRIVVVGTSYVELALARWALTHRRSSIHADELAFDMNEIVGMLAGVQTDLTPERIFEETRGWPIAIQVVQLTGVSPLSRDGHDDELMRDYIREHVLGGLPPELARFVLHTCICRDLTVEIAAALSDADDVERLLHECVAMGLFLDRFDTDEGAVYRWHAKFARHCNEILELSQPEKREQLHRAAARFFEPTDPLTAVYHWIDAADFDAALSTIHKHWVGIVVGTESAMLERVCLSLPEPYAQDPTVLLVRACAQDIAGAQDVARLLLASAQSRAAEGDEDPSFELSLPRAQLFLLDDRAEAARACAVVQAQLQSADKGSIQDHAALLYLLGWTEMRHRNNPERTAQLLSAAAQEADAVGDDVLQRRALSHLAFVLAWTGDLKQAEDVLADLGERVDDDGPWHSYAGGGASTAAGLIAYFSDDLPRASQALSQVLKGGSGKRTFAGVARMILAWTAAASKDPQLRRRAGIELHALPTQEAQGVSWNAFRHASLAALAESAGQRDRALSIAARYAETDDLPLLSVVLAGIVRRSGDPLTALQMLRRLVRYQTISYIQVATLITGAMVQRRRDNLELTHSLCEQALEIAERQNVRRPLCDGDLEMRQLLTEHLAWGTRYEDFVAVCLRPHESNSPLEMLSEREKAVFDQLRTTRTMAEIAQALAVSINTVKTHQRAIYRKLGVASRREALRLLS
ncbi:LuxR family transcriptional regulator [Microbacterium murale]|uniref:LuxR family transcriptional regulator n=1 Tax=Microbacterium murale TaxID=1081040 RepID=A0ABQ1RVP5_9MICO|nr:LuxR family transcriptional regulator [Microbacterium murale]